MEIKEFRKRTRRLLPKSKELDLWVLKGHLLIEEQVNRLIEQGMRESRCLKEARLTSQQKIKVAQAIKGKGGFEREWDFIESLNSIRNKMAHKVEVENLESLIDCAMKPFMSSRFTKSRTKADRIERLEFCISMTIGILSGMEEAHSVIFSKLGALVAWNTAINSDGIESKC